MKASLFAEDEEECDMFHDQGATKVSTDVSSPRFIVPGAQGRPSGMKGFVNFLFVFNLYLCRERGSFFGAAGS